MTSPPVSAVIICFNEEAMIGRCLKSLIWASEIIVVDAFSTDRTADLCTDATQPWARKIRFVQKKWESFRLQRNFAIAQATNDWLLVVDADEECSPELATRIGSYFEGGSTPPFQAAKVRRVEYFMSKPIHWGIWNPSYQDRFYHRKGVEYVNDVHEYPIFQSEPARIHEPLHHAPDFGPEKFLTKMVRYTAIEAEDRYRRGTRTNAFRLVTAFPALFLKNYFYYGAYKDGRHGLVISVLEGVSRAVRHVYLWKIQLLEGRK